MRLRWSKGRFVIAHDGEKDFFEILNEPDNYFVLTDIRLSTIAPERSVELFARTSRKI